MKVIVLFVISFVYNSILVFGLDPCPKVTLQNGSVRYRSKGRIVRFRCNKGFIIDGDSFGACIRGEWEVDIPKCVPRSRCTPITEIRNGHVLLKKRGASLRFICNNGYHLIGKSQLQCKNSGNWDGEPPKCQTSVQLSCDFENKGICGWDNSTKSGYFWLKRQYATPSHYLDTGPGHDHTLHPKNNGHYLYIETSGLNLKDLRPTIARLYSPLFPPVENNGTCFTFWYHMFGSTIGELLVYIDGHKVFHKSGNQGNRWIKGIVKNLPTDAYFQISIEGVPGSGWTGDIAIDDLNITTSAECTRPEIEDTTCDGRCYEDEPKNLSLCQCNQNCITTSVCCSDFFDVCNADKASTDLPFTTLQSEDETSFITTEEIFESSTVKHLSSGFEVTNEKKYSNQPILRHSVTDSSMTTDQDYTTINFSSERYGLTFTKNEPLESTTLREEENDDFIKYPTTLGYEIPNTNHYRSASVHSDIDEKNSFSQIPTIAYPSDSVLNFSGFKTEVYSSPKIANEKTDESTQSENEKYSSEVTRSMSEAIRSDKENLPFSSSYENPSVRMEIIHSSTPLVSINHISSTTISNHPMISTYLNPSVMTKTTISNFPLASTNSINNDPSVVMISTTSNLPLVSANLNVTAIMENSPTYPSFISTKVNETLMMESTVSQPSLTSINPSESEVSENIRSHSSIVSTNCSEDKIKGTSPSFVTFNPSENVMKETKGSNLSLISTNLNEVVELETTPKSVFSFTNQIHTHTTFTTPNTSAQHSAAVSNLTDSPHTKVSISFTTWKTMAPHTHLQKNKSLFETTVHMLPFINDSFEQTYSTTEAGETNIYSPDKTYSTTEAGETNIYSLDTTENPQLIENNTETVLIETVFKPARTERSRWNSKYKPKGYFTYSAIKQESTSNGMKNVGIILGIASISIFAASIGFYIYRRRNYLLTNNDVEEADVLFIPTDEILDFSLSRPRSHVHRKEDVNRV